MERKKFLKQDVGRDDEWNITRFPGRRATKIECDAIVKKMRYNKMMAKGRSESRRGRKGEREKERHDIFYDSNLTKGSGRQ